MMRFRLSAASSKTAAKLAGAVCLASLAAGCSSGVTRFDHGLFPSSSPEPISTSSTQASSLAPQAVAPVSTGPALAQPYPGDMSARSQPAPIVDSTYTSAIPTQNAGYQRPVSLAQPSASYSSSRNTVERQPLRRAPTNEQPVTNIALAPLQVSNVPTPYSAQRPGSGAASYSNPDPVITGATPTAAPRRRAGANSDGWTTTGGTRVTVGPGETLYNLSRRYGVPAKEIMKANNIADPSRVDAGQVVIIPTYVYSRKVPVSAPDNNPKTRAARASTGYRGEVRREKLPVPTPSPVRQAAVLPSGQTLSAQNRSKAVNSGQNGLGNQRSTAAVGASSSSIYTVQSGDTLSRIASRAGITVSSLKAANGMSKSTIRVGQKLRIPVSGGALDNVQTASVPSNAGNKPVQTASVQRQAPEPKTATQASRSGSNVSAPKTTGIGKLRWPARGQVMTSFGASNNGARNDGIDISMPKGTPVKAAENGVVIYAGSGLKEYGNTVLVRHSNGLVSVYGHASELIVERGDNVSRGQVVALSGMSGQANRPKLHFEVRKDAKPVDPLSYLE